MRGDTAARPPFLGGGGSGASSFVSLAISAISATRDFTTRLSEVAPTCDHVLDGFWSASGVSSSDMPVPICWSVLADPSWPFLRRSSGRCGGVSGGLVLQFYFPLGWGRWGGGGPLVREVFARFILRPWVRDGCVTSSFGPRPASLLKSRTTSMSAPGQIVVNVYTHIQHRMSPAVLLSDKKWMRRFGEKWQFV